MSSLPLLKAGAGNDETPNPKDLEYCGYKCPEDCAIEKGIECCIECAELATCKKGVFSQYPDFHEGVIKLQERYNS